MNTFNRDLAVASAQLASASAGATCAAVGHAFEPVAKGETAVMIAQALQAVIRNSRAITSETRERLAREIIAAHAESVKLLEIVHAERIPINPEPPARPFHVIEGGAGHA